MIELQDNIRIEVSQEDLDRITQRYGKELVGKATGVMLNYTKKTSDTAKDILHKENKIDTGALRRSINPTLQIYGKDIIKGEINAGEPYARFVHEGVKHKNGTLRRYFVPFKVAPKLKAWAKRHGKLKKRQKNKQTRWYFVDSNGKEHAVNLDKGGLMVYQRPTKFFSKPFEESIKEDYINDMSKIIKEL